MKVTFLPRALEDLFDWQSTDRKMFERIRELIRDCRRSSFRGIGKPEPLRDNLAGWWSRRIDSEHRLVYRVGGKGGEQTLEIMQCRFHYEKGGRSRQPGPAAAPPRSLQPSRLTAR